MNGWTGKILRVDLENDDYLVEDLDETLAHDYIGGRGMGDRILFDETDHTCDPLGPENRLIFATGPLTGSGTPFGSRYEVVAKSPLTGTIGAASSGGYFGPELKFAGYDAVIFEGQAADPVYLWIEDDNIEIRSARHLWGKTVSQTEDIIRDEVGDPWKAKDVYIASIGPAGENLVKFSCVMNEKGRAAARSGLGAVMGSKNLKAIAVTGTGGVQVADPQGLKNAAADLMMKMRMNPVVPGFIDYGTSGLLALINEFGVVSGRNAQDLPIDTMSAFGLTGATQAEQYMSRNKACFSCPMGCGRMTEVKDPKFLGKGEGHEYESIWALGANCGVGYLAPVLKAGYLCNDLGMDTVSAGVTISCAMELFEKGYLPEEDIGGKLRFGDPAALVEMVEKIGRREGFGDILAEGSYRMAEKYGHPELAMAVKKSEIPGYDSRNVKGMGLGFATSNAGGNHCRGYTNFVEVFGMPVKIDPFETRGKAYWSKLMQDLTSMGDSTGICLFFLLATVVEDIPPFLNVVTGAGYDLESLSLIGERIWNLERLFNLDNGFTRADDNLPGRFLKEPIKAGPGRGNVNELNEMLPDYYQQRGWDENGVPSQEKLSQLGL